MRNKGTEFVGNIGSIRAVEDCIRATQKYTKGVFSKQAQHPMQGEAFPSKVLNEHYFVYPTVDVSWDMPAGVAIDWLWGEEPCVDVMFRYDYRSNRGIVVVKNGAESVRMLAKHIPGFSQTLAVAQAGVDGEKSKAP